MIKPMRILAVGDESTLESLKTSIDFVFPDSIIFEAETEKDGVEQAVLNEIDIVFAAIRTNLIDGIELLRKIRKNNKLNNIPFVFLTNDDNKFLKPQALQQGADAFLAVPIDSSDLIATTKLMLKLTSNSQKPGEWKMQEELAEEHISALVRENKMMQLQLNVLQKGIEQHQETLEKLRQSEKKFRKLFEDHKAMKLLVDPENGDIIDANNAAANFYMWTRVQLRKMNIKQINIHNEAEIDEALLQAKNKNRNYFEFKHRTATGAIRDVAVYTSKIFVDNRILLHSIIHDISEHRRIYEALVANESRLNRAELASKTGNWELHLDTKEMFASPGAKEIYGLTGELFDYGFVKEIPLPEYRALLDTALINLVRDKEPYKLDFKIKSFDVGCIKDIHSEAVYDKERKTVFGIIQDITERKRLENELRELVATKDKFFSIIAHDLKSPFTSIIGFSELLNDEARTLDVDEILQYARMINTSAKNTLFLLENLLDWAQLQQGQMRFNPKATLIGELVKSELNSLCEAANHKNIDIEIDVPDNLILKVDENMFKLLVRNLTGNAIKFTRNGGMIKITAKADSEKVHFSVSDNGIGISKANIDRLFDIKTGYIARGTANEKGTGLGLILCREFVEKHHGKIWVESTEGEGSNFIFEIPFKNN